MAEKAEYQIEVDRSIDLLRESVRLLIEERGGVSLSTDCFTKVVEIDASDVGMKDVDAVMRRLVFALKKVFLDEKIPFKVVSRDGAVSIEKSDSYVRDFERQVVPRTIDKKGRISIGALKFLGERVSVNVYAKTIDGKIFVIISDRGNLNLNGYGQKLINFDTHRRLNISGAIHSQSFNRGWEVKIVVNGSYAIIINDSGENSPFASAEDYQRLVLPLLEGIR
jgi:hypothetical protein